MTSAGALASVIRDPEWLPHGFSADGSNLSFVRVTRQMHRSLPFVDERQLRDESQWAVIPTQSCAEISVAAETAPLHFVFHTAFCCSTLLIDAISAVAPVVGMKEPALFASLMQMLERGDDLSKSRHLELALRLLSRPFEGSRGTVLKPTCFANPLIPFLLTASPSSKAVLLHSDIRSFLYSAAKRGIRGRSFGRQVFASCMKHFPLELGFSPAETWELTDMQVAGLGWLMRRQHFNKLASAWHDRVLQLDGRDLACSPARALETCCRHFDFRAPQTAIEEVSAGPIFRRHSKEGRSFGPREQTIERHEVRRTHGEEVELIAEWIATIAGRNGIEIGENVSEFRLAG